MNPVLIPDRDMTYRIIGVAMRVHDRLGPGLIGSVYHWRHELVRAEIKFDQPVGLPIRYDDFAIESGDLADIIVGGEVVPGHR
jgi:GxxExxY protein